MTREDLQQQFDAAQQRYQQAQHALEAAGREMIYLKGKLDLFDELERGKDQDHGMDSA